jgi:protein-disulfide isomerase
LRAFSLSRAGVLALAFALVLVPLAVRLISTAAAADTVQMHLGADEQALGRADAPITVVEFTDYQCPYCRAFQASTWPRLKRTYVDTGKVRFVVRDLPLQIHSAAEPAAEVAHCAAEQGKFWPMHNALLSDITLDDRSVLKRAEELGLNVSKLRSCAIADKYEAAIARNSAQAASLGISATPTFIIGKATHGELTGVRVSGALSYKDFAAYLDSLLAGR